jgi:hypothetical protein
MGWTYHERSCLLLEEEQVTFALVRTEAFRQQRRIPPGGSGCVGRTPAIGIASLQLTFVVPWYWLNIG